MQDNSLLTYAVSAKTSEGVNLCFQKVAAELVGIRLVFTFLSARFIARQLYCLHDRLRVRFTERLLNAR